MAVRHPVPLFSPPVVLSPWLLERPLQVVAAVEVVVESVPSQPSDCGAVTGAGTGWVSAEQLLYQAVHRHRRLILAPFHRHFQADWASPHHSRKQVHTSYHHRSRRRSPSRMPLCRHLRARVT